MSEPQTLQELIAPLPRSEQAACVVIRGCLVLDMLSYIDEGIRDAKASGSASCNNRLEWWRAQSPPLEDELRVLRNLVRALSDELVANYPAIAARLQRDLIFDADAKQFLKNCLSVGQFAKIFGRPDQSPTP